MTTPSLIAFGHIASLPTQGDLDRWRLVLNSLPQFHRVRQAFIELPELYEQLKTHDDRLSAQCDNTTAQNLSAWVLEDDTPLLRKSGSANGVRLPLTILSQAIGYLGYLQQNSTLLDHGQLCAYAAARGGIRGFCVGLLTALAISSSANEDSIDQALYDAVRLAFSIGVYVDMDEREQIQQNRATSSLAVRWRAPFTMEDLARAVGQYPEAYVAVIQDTCSATVTCPTKITEGLTSELFRHGIVVCDTRIVGRYHCSVHDGIPKKIVHTCKPRLSDLSDEHLNSVDETSAQAGLPDDAIRLAVHSILCKQEDWSREFAPTSALVDKADEPVVILSLGKVPVSQQLAKACTVIKAPSTIDLPTSHSSLHDHVHEHRDSQEIAIVGMSGKFPGADNVHELWTVLQEARTMLSTMPTDRFGRSPRTKQDQQYWGNFIGDIASWDHEYFGKTKREAAHMDPQQRMLLALAVEALETAGYFCQPQQYRRSDTGVYIGACAVDYDFNVAGATPNAYSATGTLRSFLSGRLSHHFGWSGPSLVIDTACSSSAVAIHHACLALRTGQCYQAMAGGITLMTSPYLYENFHAAHFLTPTGGCKAFSADADGYCRGEGGGLVLLKRLQDAIDDQDHILGVIAGSGVNQNNNCVPITVPYSSSQSALYAQVLRQACVEATEVSFVEAHGTGTPVGDPIEMESIQRVFGDASRSGRTEDVFVTSLKANIGHLEGASGVAALIKALLQIQHRHVTPQVGFKSLNPKIPNLSASKIQIPQSLTSLSAERIVACVNNYGAAGSNAALLIKEWISPVSRGGTLDTPPRELAISHYPLRLTAATPSSLLQYCSALDRFTASLPQNTHFHNLVFSLANRTNQDLAHSLTMMVSNVDDLRRELQRQDLRSRMISTKVNRPKPVVLCIGGQVGDHIGLSKEFYESSELLQWHLRECDQVLQDLGYASIFPGIFDTTRIDSVVSLHSMLFALQYSCAKAWVDSGVEIRGVVGHSFGQLTAMVVCGILSLSDGAKLCAGRAELMQKHWGREPGTMILVQTDIGTVMSLREQVEGNGHTLEIACYNGSASYVLVSDRAGAENLVALLTRQSIRHKTLNVPYGFHSRFTEPLLSGLRLLASSLSYQKPGVHIETCTERALDSIKTEDVVAHTRRPVYFQQAVERLSASLGPCTWLEAGLGAGIVNMAKAVVGNARGDTFIPMQPDRRPASQVVADATLALWNSSHSVNLWHFHRRQRRQYKLLRVPTYSWDKTRHWLDLDVSGHFGAGDAHAPRVPTASHEELESLLGPHEGDKTCQRFPINSQSEEFRSLLGPANAHRTWHVLPMLPVELALRAISKVCSEACTSKNLELKAFHVIPAAKSVSQSVNDLCLVLRHLESAFEFRLECAGERISTGRIRVANVDYHVAEDFELYERLTQSDRTIACDSDEKVDLLRGNVLYRMSASQGEFPIWHRGVQSIASHESKLAAKVVRPDGIPEVVSKRSTDRFPLLGDILQVGSLHATCFGVDNEPRDYRLIQLASLRWADYDNTCDKAWDVVGYRSDKGACIAYDLFVYGVSSGKLTVVVLGATYVPSDQIQTRITTDCHMISTNSQVEGAAPDATKQSPPGYRSDVRSVSNVSPDPESPVIAAKVSVHDSIFAEICGILESIADLSPDEIPLSSSFDDIGVDSLMMIEVIGELGSLFNVDMPISELEQLTDIKSLVEYLAGKGCKGSKYDGDVDTSTVDSRSSSSRRGGVGSQSTSGDTTPLHTPPTLPASRQSPTLQPVREQFPAKSDMSETLQAAFEYVRQGFDKYARETGAVGFWSDVHPDQLGLVASYIVKAYHDLGVDMAVLSAGEIVPSLEGVLPRHGRLCRQLLDILRASGLVELKAGSYVRALEPISPCPVATLHERMLEEHPAYVTETELLASTGHRLAEFLTGKAEPLAALFGNKTNNDLLSDWYSNSPICAAAIRLLAQFVTSINTNGDTLRILEIGGGTAGTTKHLISALEAKRVSYSYTFTDISQSLVNKAKRFFKSDQLRSGRMDFRIFDCEKSAPSELIGRFDLAISTNCVHATQSIELSSKNILSTLGPGGALCLVEHTRNLEWFDLVFGLLEGWWLATDGRDHPLASETFWATSLRKAGFDHVSWTDGDSEDSRTERLICAFTGVAAGLDSKFDQTSSRNLSTRGCGSITKRAGVPMQEVVFKRFEELYLKADIYFPKQDDPHSLQRPIALLIHGGGHFLFGRKDVPMKHIRSLIERGFLPVSIDYRLCPETTLAEGPMADCCEALKWAREVLPSLHLLGPRVAVNGKKVVAVGWSSGGQLAMSLGYNAATIGTKAPDAIVAMYPPSDMASEHWYTPCYPLAAEEEVQEIDDLLAGVQCSPIIEYNPVSEKRTMALSLTLKDPRAKIVLHMCWNCTTVQTLVKGLPDKARAEKGGTNDADWMYPPQASAEEVNAINPLWHIQQGGYTVPTFFAHGDNDDWLPLTMTQDTVAEMQKRGIPVELSIPRGCQHAFDLFPAGDPQGTGWKAVEEGFDFIGRYV